MSIVYINGDFVPLEQATISVLDRGFLFADSLYEMIPVYAGKVRDMASHIERLAASCHAISLDLSVPLQTWEHICRELVQHNEPEATCHKIYIQVTRGTHQTLTERRLRAPAGMTPTIIAHCTPFIPPTIAQLAKGYRVVTHQDIRRLHCEIKSTSLMANVLIQQSVSAQDADEAILIRDDYITEGNSSNVFLVKNQQILTPPASDLLLSGITRKTVIDIAKAHQIPLLEIPLKQDQLLEADEIWITSSTREMVPVVALNGRPTGFSSQDSLWNQMIQWYKNATYPASDNRTR